jgi:hypothetical protein
MLLSLQDVGTRLVPLNLISVLVSPFHNVDKPKFVDSPGEKVSVVEGEATVVTVKAKANPDQIKYKWNRNNTPLKIKPKKLFFDGPVLNFTEVGRKVMFYTIVYFYMG